VHIEWEVDRDARERGPHALACDGAMERKQIFDQPPQTVIAGGESAHLREGSATPSPPADARSYHLRSRPGGFGSIGSRDRR
jgi:hypothetical protein